MSEASFAHFGRYLAQQRELRQISREAVAQQTKIAPSLLAALEEGQAERFPEEVFLLNLLKSYAGAVGLSADEVLGRYAEIPKAPVAPEYQAPSLKPARRRRAWIAVALVVGLALLTWVALGMWLGFDALRP